MNLEKVIFGFFILLAATLNFGFVYGDIANPEHHHLWELLAAIVVNMIATVLKFGDRTHIGAVHLASSLAALLQLIGAGLVWFFVTQSPAAGAAATVMAPGNMASIVSLAAGALLANIVSIIIMIVETALQRR
ncbi:MAG: DUF6394 family protein [Hyphomicrobiaceae bacterium]